MVFVCGLRRLRYHDGMKMKLLRVAVILGGFGAVYLLAQFLQVPPLRIAGLAAWGLACMLFSYELGGSRHIYRQGFEERNWLERGWLLAGAGCLVGAFVLVVAHF